MAEVTGTVTALKSYAWVGTEPTCPTDCGHAATTPATTFTCEEDGVTVDDALCVDPLGTKPTGTVSCPATRSCGTLCAANEKVVAHFCVACEAGKTNAAGDGTAGADTTCDTPPATGGGTGTETDTDDSDTGMYVGIAIAVAVGVIALIALACKCRNMDSKEQPSAASTKSQVDALKGELDDVRQQRQDLEKGEKGAAP